MGFDIIKLMNKKLISIIAVVVAIASIALVIIWTQTNSPESKIQSSIGKCTEFGQSIIGLTESDAVSKIQQSGRAYRVAQRDNENYPLSMDYSADRINLSIANNKIASFSCN